MQQEEVGFNLPNLNVDASSFVLDLNMEPCVEEDDIGHLEEGSYNVAFNISLDCYQTYLL